MNGKVERSQQTDKTEFWNLIDLSDKTLDLNVMAMEWQEFYNKKRPHSSLNGKTPMQKLKSVKHLVPIQPDVSEKFWESNEEILTRNYEYIKFIKHRNKKAIILKVVENQNISRIVLCFLTHRVAPRIDERKN